MRNPDNDRWLRRAAVLKLSGLTEGELNAAIAARSFPAPTPNRVPGDLAWSRDEVSNWIHHRHGLAWLRRSYFAVGG